MDKDKPMPLVVHSSEARWIGDATKNTIGILDKIPVRTSWFALQVMPQGGASDLHRHPHESVHCVLEGEGFSEIGSERVEWKAGDFIYTPPRVWHRHYNSGAGPVRMIVVENSGLLQFLGLEERGESVGSITYAERMQRQHGKT
jgi:gentisate 1,2-dioxygenase